MTNLSLTWYQDLAARTIDHAAADRDRLSCAALGLGGEAGEVLDLVKKHLHHGHDLDLDKLKSELGDVLWYVAALATELRLRLPDIAGHNIDKLRERYPDGFTEAASQGRPAEAEVYEGFLPWARREYLWPLKLDEGDVTDDTWEWLQMKFKERA